MSEIVLKTYHFDLKKRTYKVTKPKRRARGRWRVDWITKLGERRGCKNSEWHDRLKDAVDRERQLKRGGFECSIWDEKPSRQPPPTP